MYYTNAPNEFSDGLNIMTGTAKKKMKKKKKTGTKTTSKIKNSAPATMHQKIFGMENRQHVSYNVT